MFKLTLKCLVFLRVINQFWDDPWPKNRHLVEWFFIGETGPVLEKLVTSQQTQQRCINVDTTVTHQRWHMVVFESCTDMKLLFQRWHNIDMRLKLGWNKVVVSTLIQRWNLVEPYSTIFQHWYNNVVCLMGWFKVYFH